MVMGVVIYSLLPFLFFSGLGVKLRPSMALGITEIVSEGNLTRRRVFSLLGCVGGGRSYEKDV